MESLIPVYIVLRCHPYMDNIYQTIQYIFYTVNFISSHVNGKRSLNFWWPNKFSTVLIVSIILEFCTDRKCYVFVITHTTNCTSILSVKKLEPKKFRQPWNHRAKMGINLYNNFLLMYTFSIFFEVLQSLMFSESPIILFNNLNFFSKYSCKFVFIISGIICYLQLEWMLILHCWLATTECLTKNFLVIPFSIKSILQN